MMFISGSTACMIGMHVIKRYEPRKFEAIMLILLHIYYNLNKHWRNVNTDWNHEQQQYEIQEGAEAKFYGGKGEGSDFVFLDHDFL